MLQIIGVKHKVQVYFMLTACDHLMNHDCIEKVEIKLWYKPQLSGYLVNGYIQMT